MKRKAKPTLEDRVTPEPGQRTHKTPADLGVPDVWPPSLPEEHSTIHDERQGQTSDESNTGRKT